MGEERARVGRRRVLGCKKAWEEIILRCGGVSILPAPIRHSVLTRTPLSVVLMCWLLGVGQHFSQSSFRVY